MGKSKQSQRTKNNVKPSSSGRSAELLNSGKIDTGVICLTGSKIFPTLVSTTADNDISPEFQMCLKKLNKKDPVTKTKGLQELTDLVNTSKVDDVVAVLSSWAHFYKTLSIDVDRKVREHTQTCHGAVVCAAGRRAAPALRQLVPAWLRALHDAHAPAAARARLALASTFPDNKLPDVISFCKTEIFSYIVENLTSSPDAILTKKIESEEDKEMQYNDVVSSSLLTLAYLTQQLARELDQWLWDALANNLLEHSAFWKYSTHTCNQIRAAWYDAIGRIIERFGSKFGEKYGLKTMRILMGVSKEQNGLVAASLWSCLVMIMHNIEAWHTYLDKKELIVKRILDVLTNGGWGDTRHLTSVLLPLLASLPDHLLTKHFYQQFFQAMFTGLTQKSILSSKSERQLWITNVAECLRYLSVQNNEFVVEVTTSVHRTWLENILSNELCGQLSTNLIKHSATNMASLVKYWLKQSKEPNGEKFNKLIRNFWQNIGSTLLTQIDKLSTDENDIVSLIDRHVLLLQTLKTSFIQETRNQQVNKKIKFDTDSEVDVEQNSPTPEKCDPILAERFKHNLGDVVNNVCAYYFNFAHEMKAASAVIPPLLTLLIEFDGEELFSAVAKQFGASTLVKFHETVLSAWLRDDSMACKALVDVVFLMLRHLPDCEQRLVMDSFDKLGARAAEWCLQVALAHPHRSRLAVRCWLHGPAADAALHALCTSLAAAPGHALRNLLLMCFSQHDQEELLISERAVSGVVEAVCAALCAGEAEGGEEGGLEERCRAGAQLSAALLGRAHASASRLLLALVRVILRVPRGSGRLSAGTWCEVRGAVQDGAGALPGPARALLLQQVAALMREPYYRHKQGAELDITSIENACTLCPYLLTSNSRLPDDLGEMVTFSEDLLEAECSYWHAEHFALRHDCVHANLNCPFEGDNPHLQRIVQESATDADSELTKDQLVWFLGRLVLRAFYLRTLFLHKPEEEDDESVPSWCSTLLSNNYFLMEYAKVLYDYMVICTLHKGYGFWPHHCIIREGKAKLDLLLDDIVRETPPGLRKKILSKLCDLASSDGLYWAYAREHYSAAIHSPNNQHHAEESEPHPQEQPLDARLADVEASVSGNGFFHSLQASTQWSASAAEVQRSKFLVMARCVVGSRAAPADLHHAHAASLDLVIRAYYPHNRIMIFDTDITPEPWSKVVTNVAVLEYLIEMVKNEGWTLPTHHWDFINIACCSITTSVEKSKHAWGTAKVSMLARSALRLYAAVAQFLHELPAESTRRQPPEHVARLPHEWQHIFAPTMHDNLFRIIVHVLQAEDSDSSGGAGMTSCRAAVLDALCGATRHLDWSSLSKELQLDTFALSRVCAAAARCLARPLHVAYKFLAHHLLAMLVDPLILEDMAKLSMWSDQTASDGREEYDRPKLALEYFDEQIDYLQDIVNAVVAHVELGGGVCEVREFTDSHSQCVGWLLLLRVSHKLFARARSTVALHYLEIYRDNNFAEPVLNAALRLLPEQVFAYAEDNTGSAPLPPHCADMFFHHTPLDVYEPVRAALVGALACGALCAGVVCAAAGARAWASAAPAPRARALRRLVRACITPTLVKEHFTAVLRAAPDFTNAVVTIYWSTYEVMCVYTVDERPMELHITLAKDYPVGVATVHAPSVLTPCADTNWVALYLAHQNGSVVEAVRMWMQGVEARVENSPVCYICYSRLQPASGRLPRVTCHQCRNKFHVTCLTKWFHTSAKSSCPLCRAIF